MGVVAQADKARLKSKFKEGKQKQNMLDASVFSKM